MKENVTVYLTGTAGAGKSTLTRAYQQYFQLRGLDAITVNLDPGAEKLPYTPDVDIRDWIKLAEIMDEHELGPNGAQVAAADMLAVNLTEIKEEIDGFRSDFVLVDTAGQIELFVFRESGRYVVNNLNPERSLVAYLLDPFLARTPNGFVSQLLLAATVQFRLQCPVAHVLSKADVLSFEDLQTIGTWASDYSTLWDAVVTEQPSMQQQLSADLIRVLEELGGFPGLLQISAASGEGVEDLYAVTQSALFGGEDVMRD